MEAKDDAMAQRCGVCGHDHEQGVKCPICGHTGKSRSYKCFKVCCSLYAVHGVRVHGAEFRLPGAGRGRRGLCGGAGAGEFGLVDVRQDPSGPHLPQHGQGAAGRPHVAAFGRLRWRRTDRRRALATRLRGERRPGGHRRALWRRGEQAAAGLRDAVPTRRRRGHRGDLRAAADAPTGTSRIRAADRLVRSDEVVPVRRVPAGGAGRGGGGKRVPADADGLGLQPLLAPANTTEANEGFVMKCPWETKFDRDANEAGSSS